MASFYTATNALIRRDGKILMVEEGKDHVHGKWNIPGGGVEDEETPVEAIEREIKEETGLEAEAGELISVLTGNSSRDGHPVVVFVFTAEVEEGEPEPIFDQEVLNAEFKSEDEIEELPLRNDVTLKALEAENVDGLDKQSFGSYNNL